MAQRVTQQVVQVAFDTNPSARVTAILAEVLESPTAAARVTTVAVEVLHSVGTTAPPSSGNRRPVVYFMAGG